MINIKAIDHVCLWVDSLEKSRLYYKEVFGATCIQKGNNKTFAIEIGDVHFFISENEGDAEFIAKQHLSFEVDSIDAVIAGLEVLNITNYETGTVDCFKRRNYKWCEWRDPNGIRLECVEILD